jgi:hypothetical protein
MDTDRQSSDANPGMDSAAQSTDRRGRDNAANLTREDRIRGGRHSAQIQTRNGRGQFAGRTKGEDRQADRDVDSPDR